MINCAKLSSLRGLKCFTVNYELRLSSQRQPRIIFHLFIRSFLAQDWKLFLFRLWENVLLTRYIASLQYFYPFVFFRRQWKSISMFLDAFFLSSSIVCDCLLCLRRNNDHVFNDEKSSQKIYEFFKEIRCCFAFVAKNLFFIFEYVKLCLTNCAQTNETTKKMFQNFSIVNEPRQDSTPLNACVHINFLSQAPKQTRTTERE